MRRVCWRGPEWRRYEEGELTKISDSKRRLDSRGMGLTKYTRDSQEKHETCSVRHLGTPPPVAEYNKTTPKTGPRHPCLKTGCALWRPGAVLVELVGWCRWYGDGRLLARPGLHPDGVCHAALKAANPDWYDDHCVWNYRLLQTDGPHLHCMLVCWVRTCGLRRGHCRRSRRLIVGRHNTSTSALASQRTCTIVAKREQKHPTLEVLQAAKIPRT